MRGRPLKSAAQLLEPCVERPPPLVVGLEEGVLAGQHEASLPGLLVDQRDQQRPALQAGRLQGAHDQLAVLLDVPQRQGHDDSGTGHDQDQHREQPDQAQTQRHAPTVDVRAPDGADYAPPGPARQGDVRCQSQPSRRPSRVPERQGAPGCGLQTTPPLTSA